MALFRNSALFGNDFMCLSPVSPAETRHCIKGERRSPEAWLNQVPEVKEKSPGQLGSADPVPQTLLVPQTLSTN